MELVIQETAVGEVACMRVAVGNVWEDDYILEDGTQGTRSGATLYVMGPTSETDFDVRVHVGQELEIGNQKVRVKSIYEPPSTLGSVTLELFS